MKTKGIILAGGSGTRLYPITAIVSKQLQMIYDKPMIYYPLATLMLSVIKDILVISTPKDTPNFELLLGDGSQWGLNIQYIVQHEPKGIAEAFIYGEEFIGKGQVCLILGDNLFYGKLRFLFRAIENNTGGTVFGYRVKNPQQYGVVEFGKDDSGNINSGNNISGNNNSENNISGNNISGNNIVISIEEKPANPKSNYAIPGLYIFDNEVIEISKNLTPGPRGELEITDVQKVYLGRGKLNVEIMGRGIAWLDTGTPESLMEASTFIHAIEKRQGRKIACLEEIALEKGFLSKQQYLDTVNNLPNCTYKDYCLEVFNEFFM